MQVSFSYYTTGRSLHFLPPFPSLFLLPRLPISQSLSPLSSLLFLPLSTLSSGPPPSPLSTCNEFHPSVSRREKRYSICEYSNSFIPAALPIVPHQGRHCLHRLHLSPYSPFIPSNSTYCLHTKCQSPYLVKVNYLQQVIKRNPCSSQ